MILYQTSSGPVVWHERRWYQLSGVAWDHLISARDLTEAVHLAMETAVIGSGEPNSVDDLLPPIGTQEVWAAGVTYFRSRTARMEESDAAGGSDFYDRVYHADRPELFLKATPARVVGPGGMLHLRKDSRWIVPEPELTLVINPYGRICGYTIGNDLSCRDIEGENPLYLPQAKTFDACAALGPGILISSSELPQETEIRIEILRVDELVFHGATHLGQLHRKLSDLVGYLYRECSFPAGCYLMTGTGIVPPDSFSLQPGDLVRITIEPVGVLVNTVGHIRDT